MRITSAAEQKTHGEKGRKGKQSDKERKGIISDATAITGLRVKNYIEKKRNDCKG